MTNEQILAIAMAQSAIDCNCNANDFIKEENVIVLSEKSDQARKYLELPFSCQLVSYGNNIVASLQEECREIVQHYLEDYPVEHCFETPNLHALNEALLPYGQKICFMAEYFLPDLDKLEEKPCAYECRILEQKDFADLYVPEWSNALCEKRKHLDVLLVPAFCCGVALWLKKTSKIKSTLIFIGKNSLYLWFVHNFVYAVLIYFILGWSGYWLVFFLILFVVSLGVAILLEKIEKIIKMRILSNRT